MSLHWICFLAGCDCKILCLVVLWNNRRLLDILVMSCPVVYVRISMRAWDWFSLNFCIVNRVGFVCITCVYVAYVHHAQVWEVALKRHFLCLFVTLVRACAWCIRVRGPHRLKYRYFVLKSLMRACVRIWLKVLGCGFRSSHYWKAGSLTRMSVHYSH